MKEDKRSSYNVAVLLVCLFSISVIFAIIYLKMNANDTIEEDLDALTVAVPDTSSTPEILAEEYADTYVSDTMDVSSTLSTDTRSAMEAGDEDGYWDGWYDGAETGTRTRYDENSSFATAADRKTYAENYREGYEKGFAESLQRKNS